VRRELWPIGEAAQADYEALRAAALRGESAQADLAAARFARRGLAGLIAWPTSDPDYLASLVGAERPRWSGHEDPREQALCEVYGLLLGAAREPGAKLRAVGT
jgi:hypothetical protein